MINEMLEAPPAAATSRSIVRAVKLAEKITPDDYKGAVRHVRGKVEEDHPALSIARHVSQELSPRCRDRFIECLVVNTLLRGVAKRKEFMAPGAGPLGADHDPHQSDDALQPELCGVLRGRVLARQATSSRSCCRASSSRPTRWASTSSPSSAASRSSTTGCSTSRRRTSDCYFQVFTNGTLLDEAVVDRAGRARQRRPDAEPRGRRGSHRRAPRQRASTGTSSEIMDMLGDRGVLLRLLGHRHPRQLAHA